MSCSGILTLTSATPVLRVDISPPSCGVYQHRCSHQLHSLAENHDFKPTCYRDFTRIEGVQIAGLEVDHHTVHQSQEIPLTALDSKEG